MHVAPTLFAASLCILAVRAHAAGYTTFDPDGSIGTYPQAINSDGTIAGFYAQLLPDLGPLPSDRSRCERSSPGMTNGRSG